VFRRITFLAVLATSLVAALALAGSALAAPSTPVLSAMPFYVHTDQLVSWSPSSLDSNGNPNLSAYEFTLLNLTTAAPKEIAYRAFASPTSAKLDALFPNVSSGSEYILCLRAVEVTNSFQVLFSSRTCRVFLVTYKLDLAKIVNKYIEYNPNPGCIMCGLIEFVTDDPVIQERLEAVAVRDPAPITGVKIDARGEVSLVIG
jgi:hypothetical protein